MGGSQGGGVGETGWRVQVNVLWGNDVMWGGLGLLWVRGGEVGGGRCFCGARGGPGSTCIG